MEGQRLRRAAVALGEVRRGLSQSLCLRRRSARLDRPISRLLQRQEAAFETWRADARPGGFLQSAARRGSIKFAAIFGPLSRPPTPPPRAAHQEPIVTVTARPPA